jgi:hypothetical protein
MGSFVEQCVGKSERPCGIPGYTGEASKVNRKLSGSLLSTSKSTLPNIFYSPAVPLSGLCINIQTAGFSKSFSLLL